MQNEQKRRAAEKAIEYIEDGMIVGVGTGSTVAYFIEALAKIKHRIDACVASSLATEKLLKAAHIPVITLNAAGALPIYVDGADEVMANGLMVKGGGGALTREKIIATAAERFICIADESKLVKRLGAFPVAVEVLDIARSMVAREIVKLEADPEYRENMLTDNGHQILDVHNLAILEPIAMEERLKLLPGVIESGIFAKRPADLVLIGRHDRVDVLVP